MSTHNTREGIEEVVKEFEELTKGYIGQDSQGNEYTMWDVCYDHMHDPRTVGEIIIDGAFPEYGTKQLSDHLADGWQVYGILIGERYVTYLLKKEPVHDPDLGKCWPSSNHQD